MTDTRISRRRNPLPAADPTEAEAPQSPDPAIAAPPADPTEAPRRSPLFLDRTTEADGPSRDGEGPGLGSSEGYDFTDEEIDRMHGGPSSPRSTGDSPVSRRELAAAAAGAIDALTGFLAERITTPAEQAAGLWHPTDQERETAAGALGDLAHRRVPAELRGSDFLDVARIVVTGAVYLGRNLRQRWAIRRAAAEQLLAGTAADVGDAEDQAAGAEPYFSPAPAGM